MATGSQSSQSLSGLGMITVGFPAFLGGALPSRFASWLASRLPPDLFPSWTERSALINLCDKGMDWKLLYLVVRPRNHKWFMIPVISRASRVSPDTTGAITGLLTGMNHKVPCLSWKKLPNWQSQPLWPEQEGSSLWVQCHRKVNPGLINLVDELWNETWTGWWF